jgi:hypothetical protein
MNLSRLTLPGPVNNKVTKHARNKPALSPTPKKAPLWAKKRATDIAMISGMQASLVNNPRIMNAEQKNSANTTREREVVEPICKGSANLGAFCAKSINLSSPWLIIIEEPTPTRRTSIAKEKALSEVLVLNNFLIGLLELWRKFTETNSNMIALRIC